MAPAAIHALANRLADPDSRQAAAAAVAAEIGAEALIVMLRDPELGVLRPAPGFPQTLPGGPSWRALLAHAAQPGAFTITLAYPDRQTMKAAQAFVADDGTTFLLIGGAPSIAASEFAKVPLLPALLRAEIACANAAGSARAARAATQQATMLAQALDSARAEIEKKASDLYHSEKQLAAIFARAAAGLSEVAIDGRFLRVNDELCRLLGRPRETLLALDMVSITHPDDVAQSVATIEQLLRSGKPVSIDERYMRPDGSVVFANSSLARLDDEQGQPRSILVVTIDLTARRQAETALRDTEERLRLIAETVSEVFYLSDLTGRRAAYVSPAFERLWGHSPERLMADRTAFADAIVAEHRAAVAEALDKQARGEPTDLEYRIVRPDGSSRWIWDRSYPIPAADGSAQLVVGTAVDITDRKRADEHRQLLLNELNHRSKNMLAIVQAVAQQTFRPGGDPAAQRQAFEGRIAALAAAHNLLTRETWTGAALAEVIQQTVVLHDPGGKRFEINGPDVMLPPKTAVSIAMAVHELATNAVKYGALLTTDGSVEIRWRVEASGDEPRLLFVWRERGGPQVTAPKARGFGTRMIERGLAAELGGKVVIDFQPRGVVCTIDAPLPGETIDDPVLAEMR